ncbi:MULTISPECIES: hypothetical protein [unclassified Streptacidiphilus]|uniref:Secreted protein n=2 Tax=Streptacidiphilus TaxID=228398 RepID=A0ABV6UE59_9ACTN
MRRGLVRAAAWTGATAAAVSVSWFGVHRVLRDGTYEQPSALVAVADPSSASPTPPPLPTSIGSAVTIPSPSPSATPSAGPSRSATRSHTPTASASPSASPSPSPSASAAGTIQTFTRPGGRIVIDMGTTSASIVSVTPDPGWSWHQWVTDTWLRVDFQQDGGAGTDSIFYVTWNGHPPLVQTGSS